MVNFQFFDGFLLLFYPLLLEVGLSGLVIEFGFQFLHSFSELKYLLV
jgi:hypothetical protein